MFWNSQRTIIFITHSKIRSAVLTSSGKIVKELKTYEWDKDSLQSVLLDISSRGPALSRVVFSEDFSYVASLKTEGEQRGIVLEKARENIPDQLDNNWDFKKEDAAGSSSQVVAIEHDYFNMFTEAFKKAKLNIEAIEPQSITMARLIPQKGFFLFVTKNESVLFGAVQDSAVGATYVTKEQDISLALEKFLSCVKNKYKSLPEKVFVDQDINFQKEIFSQNSIEVEVCELNPLRGMALKKDITGADALVLNIDPKNSADNFGKKNKKNSQTTTLEKILAGIFFLIIIGLLIFLKI